jgi:hypothetical protein
MILNLLSGGFVACGSGSAGSTSGGGAGHPGSQRRRGIDHAKHSGDIDIAVDSCNSQTHDDYGIVLLRACASAPRTGSITFGLIVTSLCSARSWL